MRIYSKDKRKLYYHSIEGLPVSRRMALLRAQKRKEREESDLEPDSVKEGEDAVTE